MAFDLKTALGTIAPTLAAMIGGPLAGTAVTALEQAFGLEPGSGEAGITKVIQSGNMTPEIVSQVRARDQEHEEKLKQMGIDLTKINADHEAALFSTEVDDRKNARQLQVAQPSVWPGVLTALLTTLVAFIVGFDLWQVYKGQDVPDNQIIGAVLLQWGVAMGYWFGTTRQAHNMQMSLAQSVPAEVVAK